MTRRLTAFLRTFLVCIIGLTALLWAGHQGEVRRCNALVEHRDSVNLVRYCGYRIYEDGSGARLDRSGNPVRVYGEGTFPWDCARMGNHRCVRSAPR